MRGYHFLFIALAIGLLAGCKSEPVKDPGYQSYVDFVGKQEARDDARTASILSTAQSCTDARCVEHVAALAALAVAGGSHTVTLAPPQRAPSGAETFAHIVGALSPIAATLVTGAVQWHQADASRDVSIAQYGALDHIVTGAVGGMATVAEGATPSINVGGNYNTGSQVTVGHDQVGGTQYQGPVAGGDQRWASPGPVGNGCQGDGCQPQPPPTPPIPPVTPGG